MLNLIQSAALILLPALGLVSRSYAYPLSARQAGSVITQCTESNTIALTFDDGPYQNEAALLDTLAANQATASFFVNGNNWGCIYDHADTLLRAFRAGHLIGSHTWGHIHSTQASPDVMNHQLSLVEEALVKILGVRPKWFRPPYGEYNDGVLQVAGSRGYRVVNWSIDSGDTDGHSSADDIIRLYSGLNPSSGYGPITLNHETVSDTVYRVMPAVLPMLAQKGFRMVSVPECLGLGKDWSNWYEYVGEPGTRDATWTCAGTPAPGQLA